MIPPVDRMPDWRAPPQNDRSIAFHSKAQPLCKSLVELIMDLAEVRPVVVQRPQDRLSLGIQGYRQCFDGLPERFVSDVLRPRQSTA